MRWTVVLPFLCHFAIAEELAFPSPAASAELAFPLGNGALFSRLAGDTKRETFPLWTELAKIDQPADPKKPSLGFTGTARAELIFDWLDAEGEATGYQRQLHLTDGLATVTFKRGGAGFTWTTFISKPDELLVLHLRTDKPGSLSFRVQLDAKGRKAKVEDRRILFVEDKDFATRAWVYPMESDVTPGENEITVKGEGEALILLAATADAAKIPRLPDRIKALTGEGHPDTFALWNGLLERHRKAYREANQAATFPGHLDAVRK
ncbi:glycoside hydrolase family 95 protein [Luteolibacter arcticus]|uniref:Glycoside hydrolase family 95 protein n=1 Tax=Luteolibacter arcticus TaxID=1581411 RepID=A0ABT3GGL9_9BACT|nr:glycoside hydrolase family 95 protein [Luteolibacter arcticus]MCW1922751.1 glycoside hydrolase family 95 protein [Luteolibacter arcticus]